MSLTLCERRDKRTEVQPLVFVTMSSDSAFLLNVSLHGLAVQAMEILNPGQSVLFSFTLPKSAAEVEGVARVAWSDKSGRAGMEIVRISQSSSVRLAEWISQGSELEQEHLFNS
jgi:hypothetical protein